MLSKMAMEDIRELEADGKKVSPLDAISLNELGCQVETDSLRKGCPTRRIAKIGDHVFGEMTISRYSAFAQAMEITHVSQFSTSITELALTAALRLWFSEIVEEERAPTLEALDGAAGLLAELSKTVTSDTLLDVLRWLGRCDEYRESGRESGKERRDEDVFLGLCVNGSLILEMPMSEAKSLTTSQLVWALDQKRQLNGCKPSFDNAAFADYRNLLENIRNG